MEIYKEFIVLPVDYAKTIAFVSTEDVDKSWSFDIDWNFPLNEVKPQMFLESGNEEDGTVKSNKQESDDKPSLHLLAVSEAHNLLAFVTNEKSLFLCKIEGKSVVTLSRRVFLRTSSNVKFSSCGKFLVLADKTGDIFEYSCVEVDKPARWIFGHISQILDLKISSDSRFIITTDRDEKVRVTNYPETNNIESFCVGHTEFVSSAVFLKKEQLLMTASGDKTLRIWSHETGKRISAIDLEFVPVTIQLLADQSASEGLMAVSSDDNSLRIYKFNLIGSEGVKINEIGEKSYKTDFEFTGRDKTFFVKHVQDVDGQRKLLIDRVSIKDDDFATFEQCHDVPNIDPSFKIILPFDVSLLFKKKFDNVKQFIDRKKLRMETQAAKMMKMNEK